MVAIPSFEDRLIEKLRKVRLPTGEVAAVAKDFGNGFCSVQLHKGGLYLLVKTEGLRDIPEVEFSRGFK